MENSGFLGWHASVGLSRPWWISAERKAPWRITSQSKEVDTGYSPWRRPADPRTAGFSWRSRSRGLVLSINARRRTASGRRERLRRDSCGEGLGWHPGSLAKRLNHNQIWKFKMKTKRGEACKIYELFEMRECNFVRSHEGVFVCVLYADFIMWNNITRKSLQSCLIY